MPQHSVPAAMPELRWSWLEMAVCASCFQHKYVCARTKWQIPVGRILFEAYVCSFRCAFVLCRCHTESCTTHALDDWCGNDCHCGRQSWCSPTSVREWPPTLCGHTEALGRSIDLSEASLLCIDGGCVAVTSHNFCFIANWHLVLVVSLHLLEPTCPPPKNLGCTYCFSLSSSFMEFF